MSLSVIAHIGVPNKRPTASVPYFLLGLNAAGWWVVREATGRKAGLFCTRQAAIQYACDESPGLNFTIVHEPNGLEFEQPAIKRAA